MEDPAPDHPDRAGHARRGHGDPAQISVGVAGARRRPRQYLPAARRRQRHRRPQRRRPGSGDQPGPAHPVARSRQRSDRQAQARRAPRVRSGARRRLAGQARSRHLRLHQEPDEHDAARAHAGSLLRSAQRLRRRQIARHRHRFSVGESRARRARRQRRRRRLSRAPAVGQAGAGAQRRAMAGRRDRIDAQEGGGGRSQGRGVPRQIQSPGRAQQHHAVGAAARRPQRPARHRARAKGRRPSQGQAHSRHAAVRRADRILRHSQFRADPPAFRAARDVARAACRAVVVAARQPSAHQGTQGADRRSRQADQERSRDHGAVAGERRQARRRAGGSATANLRPAQGPGGDHQRAGYPVARARTRRQVAARSLGIVSGQIPRGERPRHHQFGAAGCAGDFARHGVERAGLPEKTADGADHEPGDAGADVRHGLDPRAVGGPGACGDANAGPRRG